MSHQTIKNNINYIKSLSNVESVKQLGSKQLYKASGNLRVSYYHANNPTFLRYADVTAIYFSYYTAIAFIYNDECLATNDKFSRTTSKQMNDLPSHTKCISKLKVM